MLPKNNSLKKKKDFDFVFKKGRSFKEGFLVLKIVSNNLEKSRFGIIISQKVSKKATVRNKIKRRIKVLIAKKLPQFKKNADLVLIVIPGLETKDILETEKMITKLLQRANIINYV